MDYRHSEEYGQTVAQQLRAEIAAAGHTVIEVSHRADLPRVSLDRWLKGKRPINVATLYRVCAVIPIDPRVLIDRATLRFHEQMADGEDPHPIRSIYDHWEAPAPDALAHANPEDGEGRGS